MQRDSFIHLLSMNKSQTIAANGEQDDGYSNYLTLEWELFERNPSRRAALLKATEGLEVKRVLDVGCGAGQEMLPFVERGAQGVGIDQNRAAGEFGREIFERLAPLRQVEFVRACGTELPFLDNSFDVVICRVALMYMDNKAAFGEVRRVLRQPGIFLLKYHAPAYYWIKLRDGLKSGHFKSSIHATRVLLAGYYYYFTGRQLFNLITAGGEIFQTKRTLQRELAAIGMKIDSEMANTNNITPSVVIIRG